MDTTTIKTARVIFGAALDKLTTEQRDALLRDVSDLMLEEQRTSTDALRVLCQRIGGASSLNYYCNCLLTGKAKRTRDAEIEQYTEAAIPPASRATGIYLNDPIYTQPTKRHGHYFGGRILALPRPHGAKELRKRLPLWSKQDHATEATLHAQAATACRTAWSRVANLAARDAWGRDFEATDYRISGIGSGQFAPKYRAALRTLAHRESMHNDASALHAWCAKYNRNAPTTTTPNNSGAL
jgi:hypothetical protein